MFLLGIVNCFRFDHLIRHGTHLFLMNRDERGEQKKRGILADKIHPKINVINCVCACADRYRTFTHCMKLYNAIWFVLKQQQKIRFVEQNAHHICR